MKMIVPSSVLNERGLHIEPDHEPRQRACDMALERHHNWVAVEVLGEAKFITTPYVEWIDKGEEE